MSTAAPRRGWHELGRLVRPVLGDRCLVGKGRGPRQALTRKFEHTSPRSFTPPDSERGSPAALNGEAL
jgi:hypothetical protein